MLSGDIVMDMVLLSASQIGIVGSQGQVSACYGVMNRLDFTDYSLATDSGIAYIYQLFPYGINFAFLGSAGDGKTFLQGIISANFLFKNSGQSLEFEGASLAFFSQEPTGNNFILTPTQGNFQGAHLFNDILSNTGQFILTAYTTGSTWSATNADSSLLMMFSSFSGTSDACFKLIDVGSFAEISLAENPDISDVNVDHAVGDPASTSSWFIIGHQRYNLRMAVMKISIGDRQTCAGGNTDYYNQEYIGCLSTTSISCHPLCSSCLKPNDIRACVTSTSPATNVLYASLCPLNQVYSTETGECKQVMSEGCEANCYNLCFSSPAPPVCVPRCPMTYYFDASNQICQACSDLCLDCTTSKQCETCAVGAFKIFKISGNIECGLTCPAGYSKDVNNICVECPANCYSCGTSAVCSFCVNGYYLNPGANSCNLCDAGTYLYTLSLDPTSCIPCNQGYYNPLTGQSKCTACEIGTYNPNYRYIKDYQAFPKKESHPLRLSQPAFIIAYLYINSLRYDSNACLSCPEGTYNEAVGQGSCVECPEGTANGNTGSKTKDACQECVEGTFAKYPKSSQCTACPPGTFSNIKGLKTDCPQCGPGYYSSLSGQISCEPCPPGKFVSSSGSISPNACEFCHRGTYNSRSGQSSCLLCDAGSYSDFQGLLFCTLCPPGTANPMQGSGDAGDCVACLPGEYAELSGQASCDPCLAGTFQPYSGVILKSDCRPCLKGSFNPNQRSASCEACSPGTYNPTTGSASSGDCLPCPSGSYSSTSGQELCKLCEPGTYSKGTGASKCSECPMHTYNPDYGKGFLADCLACPSGMTTLLTGQSYCVPAIEHCSVYYTETIRCQSCDSSYYLQVGDGETVRDRCLLNCIGGYYGDIAMTCQPCDPFCLTCYGPSKTECSKCALSYQSKCVENCPSHYYPFEHKCYECWSSCLDCSSGESFSCVSCQTGFLFHKGQCLNSCPEKYYADPKKNACVPCESPCVLCRSGIECLSCISGFYLMPYSAGSSESNCSPTVKCPENAYFNTTLSKCESCNSACINCYGPTAKDCYKCNYLMYYTKMTSNECRIPNCLASQYLALDLIVKEVSCQSCIASCKRCDGPNSENCIECANNIPPLRYLDSIHVQCQESAIVKKISKGICGDGVRSIIEECDDGNRQSGDGCSGNCEVEYGYECNPATNQSSDVCVDVLSPKAFLRKTAQSVTSYTQYFLIVFSEFVTVEGKLKDIMKVELKHLKKDCYYSWSLNINSSGVVLKQLLFELNIYCSTKGTEELVITFLNPGSIRDKASNALSTSTIKMKLYPMKYMSDTEKQTVTSTGAIFSISSFLTYGTAIFIILFQSFALTSFYLFVELLQLISYLPLLNIYIPDNYSAFINNYLTIKQLTIPWQLLPDWIPTPKVTFFAFITKPFNQNFQLAGLDSISFLYNFGDQLTTWLLLLVFYIILAILCKCISKKKCKKIHEWKASYKLTSSSIPLHIMILFLRDLTCMLELTSIIKKISHKFNGICRVLIECYLQMCFCSILNIWNYYQKNSTTDIVSVVGAGLGLYLCVFFLVVTARKLSSSAEKLGSSLFKRSFGTLVEDIYLDCPWTKSYTALYLFRRLIYACLLNVLYPYPILQLCSIILLASIPIKFFFCITPPYNTKASNALSIYNEFYFFIVLLSLLILNLISFSEQSAKILGWILIGLLLLSLLGTWALLMPSLIYLAIPRVFNSWLNSPKGFL